MGTTFEVVILSLLSILCILWMILPFAVCSIKHLQNEILGELREMNKRLKRREPLKRSKGFGKHSEPGLYSSRWRWRDSSGCWPRYNVRCGGYGTCGTIEFRRWFVRVIPGSGRWRTVTCGRTMIRGGEVRTTVTSGST